VLGITGERGDPGPAHTRRAGGHHHQPDGAGAGRRRIVSHDHEVVGDAGVGNEQLRAVHDDGVALGRRRGGQRVGRRAHAVLVVRHGDDALAGEDRAEQADALSVVPGALDQQSRLHRRVQGGRHQRATRLLVDHGQVEQAAAATADALRERQADPSQLGHPPPEIRVVAVAVARQGPPDQLGRPATSEEGARRAAQRLLLVGQREVRHRGRP
jgi:hypothetical protein